MIKKLKQFSIISVIITTLCSTICLFINKKYLGNCAIEDLERSVKILPQDDYTYGCFDFTDYFVCTTMILPCIILAIWAYLFIKINNTQKTFNKAYYWFLITTFTILILGSLLMSAGQIGQLKYYFELCTKLGCGSKSMTPKITLVYHNFNSGLVVNVFFRITSCLSHKTSIYNP